MKLKIFCFLLIFVSVSLTAMEEMPGVDLQVADSTPDGCSALNHAALRYGTSGESIGVHRCDGANALRGLEAGKFQIALVDAALLPAAFKGKISPAFYEVLVAYVNFYNRVKSVSGENLANVWLGVRPSWSALGGDASEIHRFGIVSGRPGGELVTGLLKIRVPGTGITWLNSASEAVLYAGRDAAALALARYQEEIPVESVRMLAINGVSPDPKTVADGTYPLARRYVWVFSADAENKIRKFLPYLSDDAFYRALLSEDLLPAK